MNSLHTITHIEIPAPDLDKAIKFYAEVFNWGIQLVDQGNYAFFIIGNTNSGGGLDRSLLPAPKGCGPQIVIDTEKMEASLEAIEKAGGKIIMAKTEIPGGHGYYAIFTDTNNNYLQLHSRK